jgi:hypothetical protein
VVDEKKRIVLDIPAEHARALMAGMQARGTAQAVADLAAAHAEAAASNIPEVTGEMLGADTHPQESCASCTHPRYEHERGANACLVGRENPARPAAPPTRPEAAPEPECGCERFAQVQMVIGPPRPGFEPVEVPTATAIKKSRWEKGPECQHASWLHCPNCLLDGKPARELATSASPSRSRTAALEEPFEIGAPPPRPPEVRVADMRQIGKGLCVCGHELLSHAGGADKCTMLLDEGPRRGEPCACTRFRSKSTEGAMAAAFLRGQRATEDEAKPPRNLEQQRIWAGYFAAFLAQDLWTVEEAEEKAEAAFERHQRRWGG